MSTIKVDTINTRTGSGDITFSRPIVADISSVTGTLPMARLTGTLPALNGSALTALNATQVTSGTLPMARLSGTLPALNGSALTALNASNLASGTVATARLGSGTANNGVFLRGDGTWAAAGVSGITDNSNANAITISADEEVTMPSQPAFASHNNANDGNATGDGTELTVDMDVESFDQGSNFASDTFTAPVTGRYLLSAQIIVSNIQSGNTNAKMKVVTSNRTYRREWNPYLNIDVGSGTYKAMTIIADMDASDTAMIRVSVSGGSKIVTIGGEATEWINFFSGALLA